MTADGAGLLAPLAALLGPRGLLTAPADLEPWLVDHRRMYRGQALALALPETVEQVERLLAWCQERRIGVVPQGGNTGYCGGATPDPTGTQLLVNLRRLNRVRAVDTVDDVITVEAGCILADVQRAASEADRLFPLSLGSEGSCQIGGNLATNAGGLNVVRYGMARDLVLGLEVVLASGRRLSTLSSLRKDNTGYDLRSLFVGSEGTLGIITAASLKLFPPLRSTVTALASLQSIGNAIELLSRVRAVAGDRITSFELMPRVAFELLDRHVPGARAPLGVGEPWYVLLELGAPAADEPLAALLEQLLGDAIEARVIESAALAQNERERAEFWHLRESIPEAQRREGVSVKHDISLPLARLARFYAEAEAWVSRELPESLLVAYGHLGDGNLHFNVNALRSAPAAAGEALLRRGPEINRAIHDLVRAHGGSLSAEHGIGRLKVAELERTADPVELDSMRAIKRALDPHGIMNPGKVLRA